MAKAKKGADIDVSAEEEVLEADHAENRVYELGFHIDPELSQEEVKKTYETIKDKIASIGTVVAEGAPEKIQLAYTIYRQEHAGRRDFDTSFFAWIAYETSGAGHQEIATAVRGISSVFRFLDVRTTKESAQHFAEMHEIMMKAAREAGGPEEEVAEADLDAALKEVEA